LDVILAYDLAETWLVASAMVATAAIVASPNDNDFCRFKNHVIHCY